ncbi:hypothetical protein DGMP_36990 [Desulfomarina profundi]|uniref:Histidine kinase/HSP90-like ATPase domain-containing protein n=1 Tax=Desulfomarina profundi TaxID=2772557 RepID=A0A8D5JTB9_9BACT|nr:ATP-binding protein [Desulfomarina profundi]BCL63006.1 hypothetical protein DGMP_36990 [Desulfomarina profundi]
MDIDSELLPVKLPIFTLQPIIENAIKHGISHMLRQGKIRVSAGRNDNGITIMVEDNAGKFTNPSDRKGLGLNIVDKRIKNLYGDRYGVEISCVPDKQTLVSILLPAK